MNKKTIICIAVAVVAVVALYFLCSPYERCMRECKMPSFFNCSKYCNNYTHW